MVTQKDDSINILEVEQGQLTVYVLGTSPLIMNRMSEKARRELLMPSGRKSAATRASSLKHDPIQEFRASPYILRGDQNPTYLGVMSSAFKGAMGVAALDLPGATKSKIGRLVYVEGDYVPIWGEPQLFMSITRSADINKTPDVRTRAIIPQWAAKLEIKHVSSIIKPPAVLNLLSAAGITAGVGDWRPEKGKGAYGRFEMVAHDDPRFLAIVNSYGRDAQKKAMESPTPYDSETEELLEWFVTETEAKGFKPTLIGSEMGDEYDDDEEEEIA